MLGGRAIAIQAPEQHLRGGAPDGGRVLCDDRDAWLQEIGEQDIVESDQSNTPVKPQATKRPECADGEIDTFLAGSGL